MSCHSLKWRHYFAKKGLSSQGYGFSSSHVWRWKLDHKKDWELKYWCFRTVVLEKSLESLLDCKEIKQVNPKGNQPWGIFGRTDAEAEALILWPPHAKSQLTGKDPDAGKDWRQEKGMTENRMVERHHWLKGRESGQAPGDSKGQGSLACCSPWDSKELDVTEQLNDNEDKVEMEMATHSSISSWKIPGTEEPGRLQSMGLHRVRHDWVSD